jgi:hypothetical protein
VDGRFQAQFHRNENSKNSKGAIYLEWEGEGLICTLEYVAYVSACWHMYNNCGITRSHVSVILELHERAETH